MKISRGRSIYESGLTWRGYGSVFFNYLLEGGAKRSRMDGFNIVLPVYTSNGTGTSTIYITEFKIP